MYKIFDDLYELNDGSYLKFNWFTRTWKNTGNICFDIISQDLPNINFEEFLKKDLFS